MAGHHFQYGACLLTYTTQTKSAMSDKVEEKTEKKEVMHDREQCLLWYMHWLLVAGAQIRLFVSANVFFVNH